MYNPGVVDQSGQIYAQGISGAAGTISSAIEGMAAQHKQLKAYRTMAVDGLGMDPDAVDKMSAGDLMGHMQAVALKSQQQTNLAKIADLQSQAKEREAIGQWRATMGARTTRQAGAADEFNRLMAGAGGDTGLSADQVMGLMSQAGLDPEQQRNIALSRKDIMDAMGGGDDKPVTFTEDDVSGARFATKGKVLVPSGSNPNKTNEPSTIHDKEGNVLGTQIWDGKKWILQKAKPTPTGKLQPVLDPITGQPIPGHGMDATGKVIDFRSTLEKSMGGAPAAPAAAASPPGKVRKYNPATGRIE